MGKKRASAAVHAESDSDEPDFDAPSDDEDVQIDFDAFPPAEDDFWGIKTLLKQTLGPDFPLSEVADALIANDKLTTVVKAAADDADGATDAAESSSAPSSDKTKSDSKQKQAPASSAASTEEAAQAAASATGEDVDPALDDRYDVYAVCSCVALDESDAGKQVRAWIKKKAGSSQKLSSILTTRNVAFIINTRFINIAPKLGVMLLQTLLKDMETAKSKPKHIILASRGYEQGGHMGVKAKKAKNITPFLPEDMLLNQATDATCMYTLPSEDGVKKYVTLYALPLDKFKTSVKSLEGSF